MIKKKNIFDIARDHCTSSESEPKIHMHNAILDRRSHIKKCFLSLKRCIGFKNRMFYFIDSSYGIINRYVCRNLNLKNYPYPKCIAHSNSRIRFVITYQLIPRIYCISILIASLAGMIVILKLTLDANNSVSINIDTGTIHFLPFRFAYVDF